MLDDAPIVLGSGPAGQSVYGYIAYADDASGTGFTTTFNASKEYIGIILSLTVLTPLASDFAGKWQKFKAADGADAYLYLAYADDSSGTGFTLTFSASKRFIGIKHSTVAIPSPVASDFVGLWYPLAGDHLTLANIGTNTHSQIDSHIGSTSNPHSVTKTQVGLGSTADGADITASAIAPAIQASSNKSSIADSDKIGYRDNVGSAFVHILWSELKTAISSWMHGLSAKTTLADNDEFNIFNSASSYSHEKITWAYVKTAIETWIHGVTTKSTPSDGDEIRFLDSGASYVSKKFTWAELKAALKAAIKINEWAAPTTALAMNSQKITGLAAPSGAGDAARYDEACYPSLTELTTVLSTAKIPVHDGAYKYATRQNLLMGVAGGINFVLNSNFEGDTVGATPSGWARYADAAGTSPVDGTGGSPNITFLASSTTVLNGTKSALLTKDAANRQGEGVSYDMAIPVGYRGKVCTVKFPYLPLDTIATGDFTVWLYDVTNSALIQPTPYQVAGASANVACDFFSEVQIPYNCETLRLIVHVSTTSTSQLRLGLDEVQVGPGTRVFGPAMQDADQHPAWVPTGSWTTNTTYTGKWQRIGDRLIGVVTVSLSGAPTAAALLINLPPGMVIDVNKINNYTVAGQAIMYDAGTAIYKGTVYVNTSSPSIFNVSAAVDTASGFVHDMDFGVDATHPYTFANGDFLVISFDVPILGWGSNCQMSSDAETRVVVCKVTGTTTSIEAGAVRIITPTTIEFDSHGKFATDSYTVPVSGYYRVDMMIQGGADQQTAGGWFEGYAFQNATSYLIGGERVDSNVGQIQSYPYASGSCILKCVVGDVIKFGCNASVTTTPVTFSGYISRISGPSQIAASEKVYCQYGTNAGQSITAAGVVVVYEDLIKDSHGCYNVSNGRFTVPRSGMFLFSGCILFAEYAGTTANAIRLYLRVNGSTYYELGRVIEINGVTAYYGVSGSRSIYLDAGDYVEFFSINQSGTHALYTDVSYNNMSIVSQ